MSSRPGRQVRPSPAALSADLVVLLGCAFAAFGLVFALLAAVEWMPAGAQLLRGEGSAAAVGQPAVASAATPTAAVAGLTLVPTSVPTSPAAPSLAAPPATEPPATEPPATEPPATPEAPSDAMDDATVSAPEAPAAPSDSTEAPG